VIDKFDATQSFTQRADIPDIGFQNADLGEDIRQTVQTTAMEVVQDSD